MRGTQLLPLRGLYERGMFIVTLSKLDRPCCKCLRKYLQDTTVLWRHALSFPKPPVLLIAFPLLRNSNVLKTQSLFLKTFVKTFLLFKAAHQTDIRHSRAMFSWGYQYAPAHLSELSPLSWQIKSIAPLLHEE